MPPVLPPPTVPLVLSPPTMPLVSPYPPWNFFTATVPDRWYYFGYGSNLKLKQMRERCPDHICIGIGVLKGYKWIINERGFANVVPSGGTTEELNTYGWVYSLSRNDMDRLDKSEGVHRNPPSYVKVTMGIELYGDIKVHGLKELPCLVYVDLRQREGHAQPEYIKRINDGLKDADLPEKWVKSVIRRFIPEEASANALEEQDVGEGKC
ncbi:hypothetical protein EV426DRAFT_613269 [Tirmania nivea]|nr:hypothetical protein EV426DRAFT_613269 [Tirmania nivea]